MSNVLHETPPRKLHQTLTMLYPFYYISMGTPDQKLYINQIGLIRSVTTALRPSTLSELRYSAQILPRVEFEGWTC